MIEDQTLLWDITVNKKYIGRCPIDPGFGLSKAQEHIKEAIKNKVINISDLEYPHATSYKVVALDTPLPTDIVKIRKSRTNKVVKAKAKKKVVKK